MKTKKWIAMVALLFCVIINLHAGNEWLTDFNKATKLSKEKNLPILVDFSGSDWCRWCIKLDNEVFEKKAFQDYAKDNLILFMADFPKSKQIPVETAKQNQELAGKYGVRGFPTVLLINADGKVLLQTGYKPGGPEAYVEHLKAALQPKK